MAILLALSRCWYCCYGYSSAEETFIHFCRLHIEQIEDSLRKQHTKYRTPFTYVSVSFVVASYTQPDTALQALICAAHICWTFPNSYCVIIYQTTWSRYTMVVHAFRLSGIQPLVWLGKLCCELYTSVRIVATAKLYFQQIAVKKIQRISNNHRWNFIFVRKCWRRSFAATKLSPT